MKLTPAQSAAAKHAAAHLLDAVATVTREGIPSNTPTGKAQTAGTVYASLPVSITPAVDANPTPTEVYDVTSSQWLRSKLLYPCDLDGTPVVILKGDVFEVEGRAWTAMSDGARPTGLDDLNSVMVTSPHTGGAGEI
jgi:hypothetical protein